MLSSKCFFKIISTDNLDIGLRVNISLYHLCVFALRHEPLKLLSLCSLYKVVFSCDAFTPVSLFELLISCCKGILSQTFQFELLLCVSRLFEQDCMCAHVCINHRFITCCHPFIAIQKSKVLITMFLCK